MTLEVVVPTGLVIDGERRRDAVVRPLQPDDEILLLDAGQTSSVAETTTLLLARCITRIGSLAPVTGEVARNLTVGDREALLLHIRRATFGEGLPCVIRCASESC